MTPSSRPTATRPSRVLVVDDDPIMRAVVPKRLLRLNCESELAEDGRVAWDLAMDKLFDLAIVDLDMPNIDGLTLIQCLRTHPRTRQMPIVVCTTREDSSDMQNALAAGASSYLLKPVNWSLFEPHIAQILTAGRAVSEARADLEGCLQRLQKISRLTKDLASDLTAAGTAIAAAIDAGMCSEDLRQVATSLGKYASDLAELGAPEVLQPASGTITASAA